MEEDKLEGTPLIAPSTTEHKIYESVVEACKSVYDPEIPVNIYDLGLIYTIIINFSYFVGILKFYFFILKKIFLFPSKLF